MAAAAKATYPAMVAQTPAVTAASGSTAHDTNQPCVVPRTSNAKLSQKHREQTEHGGHRSGPEVIAQMAAMNKPSRATRMMFESSSATAKSL
jgi:hypothetical protein